MRQGHLDIQNPSAVAPADAGSIPDAFYFSDRPELLANVPEGFDGYIWTNRIEVIGPALADR